MVKQNNVNLETQKFEGFNYFLEFIIILLINFYFLFRFLNFSLWVKDSLSIQCPFSFIVTTGLKY